MGSQHVLWVFALVAICTPDVAHAIPFVTHALEAEVTIPPVKHDSPLHSTRCFTLPSKDRETARDCLIAYLYSIESRIAHSLPVIQGNQTNEEANDRTVDISHDVVHDLVQRVAQEPAGKPLEKQLVYEILFAADILSARKEAFSVLYEDWLDRGSAADSVLRQMMYDDGDLSGIPTYEDGSPAPSMDPATQYIDDSFSHVRKAGTFQELTNPHNCEEGDHRWECQHHIPDKDPRYAAIERWEPMVQPSYDHQPLEKALHEMALRAQGQTNVSPKAANLVAKPPALLSFESVPLQQPAQEHVCKDSEQKQYATANALLQHQQAEQFKVRRVKAGEVQSEHRHIPYVVAFVTNWCPYSTALRPVLFDLAQSLKTDESIVVAEMDGDVDENNVLRLALGIRAYPTIAYIPAKSPVTVQAVYPHDQPRDIGSLTKWIADMKAQEVEAKSEVVLASERAASMPSEATVSAPLVESAPSQEAPHTADMEQIHDDSTEDVSHAIRNTVQ